MSRLSQPNFYLTEEETIDGNVTLAHFVMGAKCYPVGTHDKTQLKYDSDYGELMGVWKKFRDISSKSLQIAERQVFERYKAVVAHAICYEHIRSAFILLADAVEWYNNYLKSIDEKLDERED